MLIRHYVPASVFSACRGILAAAGLVSASTLTWIVAETQPDMTLRAGVQLIAGLCAISLAVPAAHIAKRANGRRLVTLLAVLSCPLPLLMSYFVSRGQIVPVWWIVVYGLALAILEAFSVPAQDALQNRLVGHGPNGPVAKQAIAKLRNGVNFVGRVAIWCVLALGAMSLAGTIAARQTYLSEACLQLIFASMVAFILPLLAHRPSKRVPVKGNNIGVELSNPERISGVPPTLTSSDDEAEIVGFRTGADAGEYAVERWQWRHPLLMMFVLEFALNGFFLGAILLPLMIPDKSLSVMNWVLAAGAVGSAIGATAAKMTRWHLWGAVWLDLIATAVTFSLSTTWTVGAGWVLMSFCYGMFDTLFYRTVLSGPNSRSANLASLRRVLMNGLRPFTMYALLTFQVHYSMPARSVGFLSVGISTVLVTFCWFKRNRINEVIEQVRST